MPDRRSKDDKPLTELKPGQLVYMKAGTEPWKVTAVGAGYATISRPHTTRAVKPEQCWAGPFRGTPRETYRGPIPTRDKDVAIKAFHIGQVVYLAAGRKPWVVVALRDQGRAIAGRTFTNGVDHTREIKIGKAWSE